MKKLHFKLDGSQLVGLADLTVHYLECIEWKEVRGHWMEHTLYRLVDRLSLAERKRKIARKSSVKVSLTVDECFAFVLLYDHHPIFPNNHIDNTLLSMLLLIKKHYV